jgi:hypothetical protein
MLRSLHVGLPRPLFAETAVRPPICFACSPGNFVVCQRWLRADGAKALSRLGNRHLERSAAAGRRHYLCPASPGDLEDAGKIVAGKFAFQARPGAKKVKIMANRLEGPVDPQMGLAPRVQYIPPQYSSAEKTTLTAEVTENGKNEFEFGLTGP